MATKSDTADDDFARDLVWKLLKSGKWCATVVDGRAHLRVFEGGAQHHRRQQRRPFTRAAAAATTNHPRQCRRCSCVKKLDHPSSINRKRAKKRSVKKNRKM